MPSSFILRWSVAIVLTATACADSTPLAPLPLPPLESQTWFMHASEAGPLPAMIGHRLTDGRLEQTFLDSARLTITAGGRWEQRAYAGIFLDGAFDGEVLRQDAGAWVVTDTGYLFTSDLRGPQFVLRTQPLDSIAVGLKVEGVAGSVTSVLRPTPPPSLQTGVWTANAVRDRPLPDVIYLFDPVELEYGQASVHFIVDSARITMRANGRYIHRTWVTEWAGEPGGPPLVVRFRWAYNDHGVWQRTGVALRFDSMVLQNHFMVGELGGTVLRMQHGLSHGDEPVPVRYVK